ncbi:hypothetical protein D9M68_105380 [compost metagenome]
MKAEALRVSRSAHQILRKIVLVQKTPERPAWQACRPGLECRMLPAKRTREVRTLFNGVVLF